LRATVHPRNNLAHCFCCGQNFNNIDLLMIHGYDFVPAVEMLQHWLRQYQQDRGRATS
jgi:DNA primase